MDKGEIIFVNGDSCRPYIMLSKVRVANQNNEFRWAIVTGSDGLVLSRDRESEEITWYPERLAFSDENPVYGKKRLESYFEDKLDAMHFLKVALLEDATIERDWLFCEHYASGKENIKTRAEVIRIY